MSRFDLLISRDPGAQPHPDLGAVLMGQLGAEQTSLDTLLRDGRVLLRIGVDFGYASHCAKALKSVGAVVELLPATSEAAVPAVRSRTLSMSALPAVEPRRNSAANLPSASSANAPSTRRGAMPRPAQPAAPVVQPAVRDPFAPANLGGDLDLQLDLPPRTTSEPLVLDASPSVSSDLSSRRTSGGIAARATSAASLKAARVNRSGSFPSAANAVRTCPRCGTLLAGTDECPRCAEGDVPSMGDAGLRERLHQNPPLRYALGFALALGAGYVVQAPYARRQEARVLQLRADANQIRYRPDATLQARARAHDAEADDIAQHAALTTGGIWLVIAAIVFGAWFFFV